MEGSTVYVVDDDAILRSLVTELTASVGLRCTPFSTADQFLQAHHPMSVGCLVLDIGMPGMNGLQLQDELNRRGSTLPIIFMTGKSDVPMAVEAMKYGAFEFLQKPVKNQQLLSVITRALQHHRQLRAELLQRDLLKNHLMNLTARERQILDLMATGATNKEMATTFEVSERTIEVHRARVMRKMQARSLAHLIRMVLQLEDRTAAKD